MTKSNPLQVVCRQCRNVLTTPLSVLTNADQICFQKNDNVIFRENLITTAGELRLYAKRELLPDVFQFDWIVANQSVIGCTAESSTFGCCGHTPNGNPNLMCRCGVPIGWEWSDCIDWEYTVFDNRMTFVEMIES